MQRHERKSVKKWISLFVLITLLTPLLPQGRPIQSYADVYLFEDYFTETVGRDIRGTHGSVQPIDKEVEGGGADSTFGGGSSGGGGGSSENSGWERTFQMRNKFVDAGLRTWITPKHAVYADIYINGVFQGNAGFYFKPKDLVNYSNGGCKITITADQFWRAVKDPRNNVSGLSELKEKTGLSEEELESYVKDSYVKGCGVIFNAWAVCIRSKGPGHPIKSGSTKYMYHNPDQINYHAIDGVDRSVWAIKPDTRGADRVYNKAGATAFANGTLTGSTSFIYVNKFVEDFEHYAHVLSNSGACTACDAYVHKYFYVKKGDTETLENYKQVSYKKENGYQIKHEDGYHVVAWHTITDETKCKPEPGIQSGYDAALARFNRIAQGKEVAKLPKEKTLQPAPKGSEIAIKLIREENIPEVQDKETILEITQKRISKHFDLSPWGSKESPPVVLTYTWPSVPGCVCLKCNPGPGECTEYCYSTVEPSMTFIIDQINKTRNDLLAEVEYFLSYFENDSNYEMVSRGDEAGQHEMKPNYHYILWRGKDVPTLASYKYRTKEAQEQAAPLYKHLIDAMNHKPVHPRYGLNDPNYDKEENKGIIYEDQLTLTFGGVPNYSYLEEDLQTTAMRGSCSDPVYANQKASRPVPQNLHAKVLVHCYHGLPNNGI